MTWSRPPRTLVELDEAGIRSEWARPVKTARVAYLDVGLLRRDFPHLVPELKRRYGPSSRGPTALLERWLVQEAGIISEAQLGQEDVNTAISHGAARVLAFRPPRYGRSLVREVAVGSERSGLLDLKGAGVEPGKRPSLELRGNGLCDLGEMLRDLAMQKMIELIFDRLGMAVRGVPVYAVLDYGFDRKHEEGVEEPAGLQVRQGHQRPPDSNELSPADSEEARAKFQIEMILRSFGITSCHPGTCFDVSVEGGKLRALWGGLSMGRLSPPLEKFLRRVTRASRKVQRFAGVNIQLTRGSSLRPLRATLVDFGQYHVRDDFRDPVVNLAHGPPLNWGGCLWPEDPSYVRPDPRLQLPVEQWGRPPAADKDPSSVIHVEGTYRWSFDVSRRFRRGQLDHAAVARELEGFIAAATAHWP